MLEKQIRFDQLELHEKKRLPARDAIDTLTALARTKTPMLATSSLATQHTTHERVGRAEARLRSGRALLYETVRKLPPGSWRSPLPRRVRIEALIHLTANLAYPLLLALGLLLLPVLLGPASQPPAVVWTIQAGVLVLGVVPVCLFLGAGRRRRCVAPEWGRPRVSVRAE